VADSKDSNDIDEKVLSSMNAPALREYIRSLLSKRGKPSSDKESDKADKEREALADLHEEHTGKAKGVPVEKEDISFDLGEEEGEEEDSSEAIEDADKTPKKKRGE
jgi:hypothetical protein